MDILLDSNIYRSDLNLNSAEFEVVMDYLTRTGSMIVMPQMVLDEISELHRKEISDRTAKFNAAAGELNSICNHANTVAKINIDFENESKQYADRVLKKVFLSNAGVIPYKDSYLSEIARRAVKKQKPCGAKGQGFRDAIIWLTLKDYIKKETPDKKAILISKNDSDFANSDGSDLHEILKDECKSEGIEIVYYKNLSDFIEKQSKPIDFITPEWLNSNIDHELLKQIVLKIANSKNDTLILIGQRRNPAFQLLKVDAVAVDRLALDNFFIYEKQNGSLIVKADIEVNIIVTFEFVSYSNDPDDYPSLELGHDFIDVVMPVTFTIENKAIVSTVSENVRFKYLDIASRLNLGNDLSF